MLYIVAVLKLWSQKLALFLKMTEEIRAFFVSGLSLLKFTTLEIKTEELKIFIYEHLKATICSWHCSINSVYPVKICYFFQNGNLEEEWHVWYFGRTLFFWLKWETAEFSLVSALSLCQYIVLAGVDGENLTSHGQ